MPYDNFTTPSSKYLYGNLVITDNDLNKYLDAYTKLKEFMDGDTFSQFRTDHPEEAEEISAIYSEIDERMNIFNKTTLTEQGKAPSKIKINLFENAESMRKILNILEPYRTVVIEDKEKEGPVYKAFFDFKNQIERFDGMARREANEKRTDAIRESLGLEVDDGSSYVPGQLAKEVKADILFFTTPEKPGFKEMLDHFHSLKTTEEKMKMLYGCTLAMETKPDTSLSEGETNAYHIMLRETTTPLKKDGTIDEVQKEANIRALVGLYCEATVKLGIDEEALGKAYEEQGKNKKEAYVIANQTSPWTMESVAGQQLINNIMSDDISNHASSDAAEKTSEMISRVTVQILDERSEAEYAKAQRNLVEGASLPDIAEFKTKRQKLFDRGRVIEKLSDSQLGIDKAAREG